MKLADNCVDFFNEPMRKYADLIDQAFYFPTAEFKVEKDSLHFHGVNLMEIIKEYGTPLKLSYLPKIEQNITYAYKIFENALNKHKYEGSYTYAYCTKSSHFRFVLEEVLSNGAHIETSSAYDIPIVRNMHKAGKLSKEHYVICNGFKRPLYLKEVTSLLNEGYKNCVPILDNLNELKYYEENVEDEFQIGIRIAADEEPNFAFYTSRLGIRYSDILPYYKEGIKDSKAKLKMLLQTNAQQKPLDSLHTKQVFDGPTKVDVICTNLGYFLTIDCKCSPNYLDKI